VGVAVQLLVCEPTKFRQKLRVFYGDMWNLVDSVIIALFFAGFTIRLMPGLVAYGRVFYCLVITIFVIRILDFFDVSRKLGPLTHIIGKMVRSLTYLLFDSLLHPLIAELGRTSENYDCHSLTSIQDNPAKNWRILLEQSFTACMPLLMTVNTFGIHQEFSSVMLPAPSLHHSSKHLWLVLF